MDGGDRSSKASIKQNVTLTDSDGTTYGILEVYTKTVNIDASPLTQFHANCYIKGDYIKWNELQSGDNNYVSCSFGLGNDNTKFDVTKVTMTFNQN